MIFTTWSGRVSVRTQQYRLDHMGALYDMLADPGQAENVAAAQPEVAARLRQAVEDWRTEMLIVQEPKPRQRQAVDPRPIDVGYPEFPVTMLPARDGEPHGGVQRSSNAPNCSYFVDWTSREGSMVWNLRVQTPGDYHVVIDYTCPLPDAGSLIELSFGDSRLTGRVAPGWDPPLYTNQDTLPRPPGESPMKEFRPLDLGTIRLEPGRGELTLRALEIPGRSVMDVRRVTLALMPAR